jgi:hypothetical protein
VGRVRPGEQRVGDTDRFRVAEQLAHAYAVGMLTSAEYDQRVIAAWAAATSKDLATLTADLHHAAPDGSTPPDLTADTGREMLRAITIWWACASAFTLTIWVLLCLLGHRIAYPGFAWVIGPTGSVLAVLWPTCGRHGKPPHHLRARNS